MSLIVEILTIGLSFIASAVPTAVYVLLVWWIDRYEKEPLKLLACALLWGAIIEADRQRLAVAASD